jgi:type IV pilus assembly protein PilN
MIRINLAPPSTKRARSGLSSASGVNLGLVFGVVFVALIALLGGYWWKVSSEIRRLNGEIALAEAEKTRLAAVIAEGQRYKREKEELESRVNAIEQIARDQARPTYLMDAMADVLPADLWLARIEEKGQQLRLAGTTYSSVALSDFMSNLKASGKFKDVDLIESRQDLTKSPRTITFEVSCRFEI